MSNSTDFYNNLNNFSGYMNALSFGNGKNGQPMGYSNLFGQSAADYQNAIGSQLNPAVTYGAQGNYLNGANALRMAGDRLTDPSAWGNYNTDTANARSYINSISPGYSDAEAGKMRYGAMAPIAGAYGDAATQAKNASASTGNAAGLGTSLKSMARQKGAAMSQASAQTEGAIADARRQDTLAKANLMPIPGQMEAQGINSQAGNATQMYGSLMQGGTGQYNANTNATSLMGQPMNSYLNALGLTTGALGNTLGLRSANAYKGSVTSGINNFATIAGAFGGK